MKQVRFSGGGRWRILGGGALVVGAVLLGCSDQESMPAGLKVPPVGPVALYDVTLGPDAEPQQVAYVLMRLLRDDVAASQAEDWDRQRAVLQDELKLAARSRILRNVEPGSDLSKIRPEDLDNAVYKIVNVWAPIAGRYVSCFTDDLAAMTSAMRVRQLNANDTRVSFDVTDPQDGSQVTFQVFLTKEPGASGKATYWRVYRLGYVPYQQDDAVYVTTRSVLPSGERVPATAPAARGAPPTTQPASP
jgi:hypothetical protein